MAPIVEVLLVVGRSCLWEVLDGVDGNWLGHFDHGVPASSRVQ